MLPNPLLEPTSKPSGLMPSLTWSNILNASTQFMSQDSAIM